MSNQSPVQPQLLSRINEALVLRTIRQKGPSTRGELSHHMGVTFPTVAKAVASLLEARLLEEFGDEMTGPGRPAKRLRLSKERSQVVGVTVDVESCAVASAGFDGVVRDSSRQSFATPPGYDELLAELPISQSRSIPSTRPSYALALAWWGSWTIAVRKSGSPPTCRFSTVRSWATI